MIRTTIRWASPYSLGLLLASALALAVVYLLMRWAGGRPLAPSRRRGLWILRGLIVATLLLIMLNPVRVEETPGSVERPRVAYLVDTSESMALGKADGTRWDQVVRTIREADRSRVVEAGAQVGVYRFGSRLEAVEATGWLSPGPEASTTLAPAPTDPDTLLTASLEALAGRFGQDPPEAVVVFSDGRSRDPDRSGSIARGYGRMNIPIHVVPVGDEDVGGDVAIVSMVAPNLVRKSSRIPVQLFVRSYGYKGRSAELKLSVAAPGGLPGALLARTPIALKDGLASYALTFESGDQDRKIVASVDPQVGEVSTDNNAFAADVAIDHTKVRVLYLEGSTERYVGRKGLFGQGAGEILGAYSPLQKALMEDPDVECTVVTPTGATGDFSTLARSDERGRGMPEAPSELYAYDAIILSDVPRDALTDQQLTWIDEWIGRRGGGLCMVGGPNSFGSGRWAGTSIGKMLPVEFEAVDREWDTAASTIQPVAGASIHPIWQVVVDESKNRSILKAMPNFLGHNRLGKAKPTADVLATFGVPDSPAIAVQPYGRGRSMAMATGITRRFSPEFGQSWGEGDARYYKKFWRNAVYWLTENSSIGRRRLLAETDKRLYRPGEPIQLRARAFDENAGSTLDYRVAVSIEPRLAADTTSELSPLRKPLDPSTPVDDRAPLLPWGEEFSLAKLPLDKLYAATLPIADPRTLPTGVKLTQGLRIELTAYEGNTQVDSTALDIQILDDPTEQQNPLPDHDLLRRIADQSGGHVLKDANDLAAMLAGLPITVGPPEIRTMPAWSRWWLLAVLLGMLTVEWVWRRRVGMA